MWFCVDVSSEFGLLASWCCYQIIHVVGGTLNASVTSHCVQRESIRPGAVGDAQLELKAKRQKQEESYSQDAHKATVHGHAAWTLCGFDHL